LLAAVVWQEQFFRVSVGSNKCFEDAKRLTWAAMSAFEIIGKARAISVDSTSMPDLALQHKRKHYIFKNS